MLVGFRARSARECSCCALTASIVRRSVGRASDRRPASSRRILCSLRGRFERAVEADDGTLGYLLERTRAIFGLSSRSGRCVDGRFECAPARDLDARSSAGRSRFNFTPPGGYQFQSNEVDVQLGSREGFFVVEARRGDVGEQVWINRTRVGLVSKETPGELLALRRRSWDRPRARAHARAVRRRGDVS